MRAVRRAVQPVAGWPRQVQILALYDKLHLVDAHKVGAYVAGLQQADGSFEGDEWGEVDTRFTYCALSCLSILHCTVRSRPLQLPSRGPSMVKDAPRSAASFARTSLAAAPHSTSTDLRPPPPDVSCALTAALPEPYECGAQELIDVKGAMNFVAACRNFDGGFGATPGDESHAGQIFTAVGALAIGGGLHHVDRDLLGWWLCERQVKGGGLNGASPPTQPPLQPFPLPFFLRTRRRPPPVAAEPTTQPPHRPAREAAGRVLLVVGAVQSVHRGAAGVD